MNILAEDYIKQAINLMGKPDLKAAEATIRKAIELDPRNKEARVVLGDIHANNDLYDEALAEYNNALLIDPTDGELYFYIGNIYVLKDDLFHCIESYNKAEENGFHSVEMYLSYAQIYRILEKSDIAIRNYNKAIRQEPLNTDLRLEKIGYYAELQLYHEALEELDQLKKIEPDLYEAMALQIDINVGLGRYDRALELSTAFSNDYPEDEAILAQKAKVFLLMDKAGEAKELIADIKKKPDWKNVAETVLTVEAQICASENRIEDAIRCFEELIQEQDEYNEETHFYLLNCYYAAQDYEKALEVAKELSARDNKNVFVVTAMYYIPFMQKKLGNVKEAKEGFKKLTSTLREITVLNPHLYEGYLYRILCHKEIGEFDKALELCDYIEALDDSSIDPFSMRYAVYKEMGDEEKADKMRKIVYKMNPQFELE